MSLERPGPTQYQGTKRAASPELDAPTDSLSRTLSPDTIHQPSSKHLKRSPYGVASTLSQGGHAIPYAEARRAHIPNIGLTSRTKVFRRPGSPIIQTKHRSNQDVPVKRELVTQHQLHSQSETEDEASGKAHYAGILLQPESRPITSDQLAVEVKNIYSDLVAVEAKCINLDGAELGSDRNHIEPEEREKWQAMIALHRTLLYEHHDFLSASQHPAANESLTKLALKYSMPARMWKHAIHSFLEVLRRRLPDSMDYMLQFIYTAYQMIALLYETIETFKATWIECLGDLARYRMAIEDGVQRDRETWGVVARSWYSMASDMNPQIGRLYHHLGILARPNVVQQLSFYCRALTCVQPFPNARESLSTLLTPALESRNTGRAFPHVHEVDAMLLYLHAAMFMGFADCGDLSCTRNDYEEVQAKYLSRIGEQIDSPNGGFKDQGVFVAIANISACFGYGHQNAGNPLILAFENDAEEMTDGTSAPVGESNWEWFWRPANLLFSVFAIALHRKADYRVLPHVHVFLVFLRSVASLSSRAGPVIGQFLQQVPWTKLADFLNSFAMVEPRSNALVNRSPPGGSFIGPKGDGGPLPEDYSLRGELWTRNYFSEDWFNGSPDEETRYLEHAGMDKTRMRRVLHLGLGVSQVCLQCCPMPAVNHTENSV